MIAVGAFGWLQEYSYTRTSLTVPFKHLLRDIQRIVRSSAYKIDDMAESLRVVALVGSAGLEPATSCL